MSGAPKVPTQPGEAVTAGWATTLDMSVRCDRTIFDATAAKACTARIAGGSAVWIEEHRFAAPQDAPRGYAVVTCEDCRLSEIAHEWADEGSIPTHVIATGSNRALAGAHLLTADQYRIAEGKAKVLLAARAVAEPDPVRVPTGEKTQEELLTRERRKVRAERDTRGQLAG